MSPKYFASGIDNFGGVGVSSYINLTDNLQLIPEINTSFRTKSIANATLALRYSYAPGASVSYLVNAIFNDTKEVLPCSVLLEGEYGAKDLCIGVPAKIGKNGFEEVIQLDLNNKDLEMFQNSVSAVKETNSALDGLI